MTRWEPWSYSEEVGSSSKDLIGFRVEAADGHIGKVDEASYDVGSSHLVVDTGPWIFGKKVLLPAGIIENVDRENKQVYVGRSKDEIKNSPPFDAVMYREPEYRGEIGNYYGRFYPNY